MMVVVLVGVQGSLVLQYVYSIGPSEMIGHKLWVLNSVRLGGQNIWGSQILKPQGFLWPF